MKNILSIIFMTTVLGFALQAATIDLASGGKTSYTIVAPENPSGEEQEAVKDLRWHLNHITGAKFNIGKAGEKNIFVGHKAPSDNKPLARYERRIRTENGNIYLYGSGIHGNSFAIYDFLEKYLDCQWYSFFGDVKIPKRQSIVFESDKLDRDIIPSFNSYSYRGNVYTQKASRPSAFRRRARIYDNRSKTASSVEMLTVGHVPSMFIPSGFVKPGSHKPVAGPLPHFKDKKYYKTNPEFFSLDASGKRNWQYQLCYSNKELRKELIKNYQIFLDAEYKGGEKIIHFDLNDKGKYGMPTCHCKECGKLIDKYGDPSGAFYDALIETANHFMPKYPQLHFHLTVYQLTRDVPKKFKGKLPRNVMVRIAALDETNFIKPYRETPAADKMFDSWAKICSGDFGVQFYPTVYPRPLFTRPLVANIDRLVQNMYYLYERKVTDLDCEYGDGPTSTGGFNELRMYILGRLANDIKIDVKAVIEDFMLHYYGEKAAPIMLKYYYELEECEKNETRFMRWWPDHRSCLTYLTPENILRWQGYFDEMLKITDRKSRHHLNIRRARQNLDEATLSIWYKFAPGTMPDRDVILKRHTSTAAANTADMLRSFYNRKEAKHYHRSWTTKYNWRPIYYHYALAGEWKALPEPFASMPKGDVLRTVPYVNKQALVNDPEAATGITAADDRKTVPATISFSTCRWDATNVQKRENFPVKLAADKIKSTKGYNFYYIGTIRLYPDINIYFNMIYSGGVALGYLYDEKNPDQLYDVYVSIKYDEKNNRIMSDQVVLVKSKSQKGKLKEDRDQRINDPGQFA